MTIGTFAIEAVIGRRDDRHSIRDYRGLATRQPLLAALLAFILLAQAGIPPTGGFIAKLGVIASVANSPTASGQRGLSYSLLIVGVVASVIAAFFYLRVVVTMYSSEADAPEGEHAARGDAPPISLDIPTGVVLVVCAALTLWVGILPSLMLEFARDATLIF
jgi:NADH-quinone oxidoreductase subunit N